MEASRTPLRRPRDPINASLTIPERRRERLDLLRFVSANEQSREHQMREICYVATPNLQGAYVTVSDQVHVLLRLKGLRPVSRPAMPAQEASLLAASAKQSFNGRTAHANASANLAAAPSFSTH